eukprot:6187616-Prymnesium_polylepis.1
MFESCSECRGRKGVMHMELDLRVSGEECFPDEEPFCYPVDWDGEDEGDANKWAAFIKDAYINKAAETRPLRFCNPVTHVLIVHNITHDFQAVRLQEQNMNKTEHEGTTELPMMPVENKPNSSGGNDSTGLSDVAQEV